MDLGSALASDLSTYSVLIAVGILVFAIWGVAKAGAKAAGSRFGWGAVGAVLLLLGVLLWGFAGQEGLGGFLALIGLVVLLLALAAGRGRR